jgi:hypothetical protein
MILPLHITAGMRFLLLQILTGFATNMEGNDMELSEINNYYEEPLYL